jgi:hypothetical protein
MLGPVGGNGIKIAARIPISSEPRFWNAMGRRNRITQQQFAGNEDRTDRDCRQKYEVILSEILIQLVQNALALS